MCIERFLITGFFAAVVLAGCGKSDPGVAAQTGVAGSAPIPATLSVSSVVRSVSSTAARADLVAEPPLAAEIVAFRKRRDACDHFRGEEPYDAKRAAFLAAEVAKNCTGTDRALADLRRRYAHDAKATAALKDYEARIE